jgi:hypothetical protein
MIGPGGRGGGEDVAVLWGSERVGGWRLGRWRFLGRRSWILLMGAGAPHRSVLINGDQITGVVGQDDARPAGWDPDTRIDAGGRIVMPGLIDAHVHLLVLAQIP